MSTTNKDNTGDVKRISIMRIIVYKPKGELRIQESRLETSQSVYAIWHM
jgi:hypothetical protein